MNGTIKLRNATIKDGSFILSVRNHVNTFKYLHDSRVFTLDEFEKWFNKNKPIWYIIMCDGIDVGYVRTKWIVDAKVLQVGADIAEDYRRMGFATAAYNLIFDLFRDSTEKYTLEVFEDNVTAMNLYKKLGFVESNRYEYSDGYSTRLSIVMEKVNES